MPEMASNFDSPEETSTKRAWKGKGRRIEGPEEGAGLDKGQF